MSSKKKESLVIALLLLVFSVILFFSATRIPVSGALGAGADFLPKVGSVLLFCCACSFLVQFVRTPKEEGEAAAKAPDRTPAVRFFLALGLLALYVAGLQKIGFILMTIFYVFCQSLLMVPKEKRSYPVSAVLAVAVALLVHGIFAYVLKLRLPAGLLSNFL